MLNKRHISVLFLFIFIFSNVGWSVNVHFCQDEIYSELSYLQHSGHQCAMEKETKPMPCCEKPESNSKTEKHHKDKDCCTNQVIKSNAADQSVVKILPLQFEAITADISWTELQYNHAIVQKIKNEHLFYYVDSNAPPLFKLYCKLIFYA